MSARSAYEIPVPALAHRRKSLLRRNAPVHQPEAADLPVLLLQPPDERHLRLPVARVAGHDLVGEGEAVGREDERLHERKPVRSLAARAEARRPEPVEPELVPQLAPEPDLAPVPHVPDGQPVHADAHDLPVVRLGRTVFREELQLPDVAFLVKGLDGALPFLALRVVQFAEVERLTHASSDRLRRLGFASGDTEDATTDAYVLHHAPVVVDLAVLEPLCSPQKHGAYYRMFSTCADR